MCRFGRGHVGPGVEAGPQVGDEGGRAVGAGTLQEPPHERRADDDPVGGGRGLGGLLGVATPTPRGTGLSVAALRRGPDRGGGASDERSPVTPMTATP